MKKLYYILIIGCLTAIQTMAQENVSDIKEDTINRKNENNQRIGYWITRDKENNNILEQGQYINDKKEGKWTSYYPSGKIKHIITFRNGIALGTAVFYYDDGTKWEEGIWEKDKWIGEYKFYYPTGQLSYHWNYNNNGKREGKQLYYHNNGKLKYEGTWINGQSDGIVKEYNSKGQLTAERVYDKGKIDKIIDHQITSPPIDATEEINKASIFTGNGNHTIYTMSGEMEKQGYFQNGKLIDGKQYLYDKDGKLTSILIFEKGKLVKTTYP